MRKFETYLRILLTPSASFADVESDTFWSNLSSGDDNKMTLNCDDLF